MMINMIVIDDNVLYDYIVFQREGWYSLTSTYPYLQVSVVISYYVGGEKVKISKVRLLYLNRIQRQEKISFSSTSIWGV